MRLPARVSRSVCLYVLGWLLAFGGSVLCGAQSRDERAVRAAYVFNLTKYIDWAPENHDLNLCFLGDHASGDTFQKMLDGKTSLDRTIHVLFLAPEAELDDCSVLYVTGHKHSVPEKRNLLTVGESEWFAQEGGMVGLVRIGDQIEVQVNVEAAQRAGVKISSRLLSVAHLVKSGGGVAR